MLMYHGYNINKSVIINKHNFRMYVKSQIRARHIRVTTYTQCMYMFCVVFSSTYIYIDVCINVYKNKHRHALGLNILCESTDLCRAFLSIPNYIYTHTCQQALY